MTNEQYNVCDNCPYKDRGTSDGDCIYAGLCGYGIFEPDGEGGEE